MNHSCRHGAKLEDSVPLGSGKISLLAGAVQVATGLIDTTDLST